MTAQINDCNMKLKMTNVNKDWDEHSHVDLVMYIK